MFATRGAAAGVDVDFFVLPDLPHAFQVYDCGITRAWAQAPVRVDGRAHRLSAAAHSRRRRAERTFAPIAPV